MLARKLQSAVCPQPLLTKKLSFLGSLEEKVNWQNENVLVQSTPIL